MAKRNPGEEGGTPAPSNPNPQISKGYPEYLQAAARLSACRPLGAPRVDTAITRTNNRSHSITSAVPGIMVLDYFPCLGVSENAESALNRSTFYEFNKIRRKISGNRPYEPVDHMIYRICVDSLRDLYEYIKRAYGIVSGYSAMNVYKPKHVMEAMGLDFDSWDTNSPAVYQWLQNHRNALHPFPTVPIGKITARRAAFNSAIFTDGDAPTSQMYIFNQVGYYSYEKVDEVKGVSIRVPEGGEVWDYFRLWNEMYTALQASSDVYTMTADIFRAFEDNVVMDLTPPEAAHTVPYVKLDSALTSIMNATTLDVYTDAHDMYPDYSVWQEALRIRDGGNGILLTATKAEHQLQAPPTGFGWIHMPGYLAHLNFVEANPSDQAIVDAVRFKPAIQVYGTIDSTMAEINTNLEAVGTEVILRAKIYSISDQLTGIIASPSTASVLGPNNLDYAMRELTAMRNFDWCPPSHYSLGEVAGTNFIAEYTNEDIQNYVPLSRDVLSNIINAILMSEFGLPD